MSAEESLEQKISRLHSELLLLEAQKGGVQQQIPIPPAWWDLGARLSRFRAGDRQKELEDKELSRLEGQIRIQREALDMWIGDRFGLYLLERVDVYSPNPIRIHFHHTIDEKPYVATYVSASVEARLASESLCQQSGNKGFFETRRSDVPLLHLPEGYKIRDFGDDLTSQQFRNRGVKLYKIELPLRQAIQD